MKLAALSDIHSNIFALEAVIADAQRRGVDQMVNLGDILYGPIAPRATYELLMEHDFVTIRGNQDRQLFEATAAEIDLHPTMQFICEDLGSEPLEWMSSLPFDLQLNEDVYICHGSSQSDLVYLLENAESGYARLRSDGNITELLGGQRSPVVLCGHTHTARAVQLSSGPLVVNPGSVGMPAYTDQEPYLHSMESHSPHASYAVLEKRNGGWLVEHIKVPYEFERAVSAAKERDRADWAHFLATGKGLQAV